LFICATVNKLTEIASKANAEKKKKSFEEMVPKWLMDYCSLLGI